MKALKIFAFAAVAAVMAVSCGRSEVKVDVELPTTAEIDSVSYLLGVNYGIMFKQQGFAEKLSDIDMAAMKKGMEDALKAELPKGYNDTTFAKQFKISPESMNEVFNSYLAKRRDYTMALNKEKETKFLAENQKKDSVQVSASGLQYIIRAAGNDVKPSAEDTVFVHYKGTLLDGTTFDESPANDEGIRMLLNHVIAGWTEGLQLIGEGGKIRLFVPSALGYGENGNRGIEPNSTLIFDVELVKVNKVAATTEEESK